MNITNILTIALSVIGGATIILRSVAPLTKTKLDNKVLEILKTITSIVSLDSEGLRLFKGDSFITIPINKKRKEKVLIIILLKK